MPSDTFAKVTARLQRATTAKAFERARPSDKELAKMEPQERLAITQYVESGWRWHSLQV